MYRLSFSLSNVVRSAGSPARCRKSRRSINHVLGHSNRLNCTNHKPAARETKWNSLSHRKSAQPKNVYAHGASERDQLAPVCSYMCSGGTTYDKLRRMISFSSDTRSVLGRLRLTSEFRADLSWWREFPPQWNGKSSFLQCNALFCIGPDRMCCSSIVMLQVQ